MKRNQHQILKQQYFKLCWKRSDGAQSFVFRWQIATE